MDILFKLPFWLMITSLFWLYFYLIEDQQDLNEPEKIIERKTSHTLYFSYLVALISGIFLASLLHEINWAWIEDRLARRLSFFLYVCSFSVFPLTVKRHSQTIIVIYVVVILAVLLSLLAWMFDPATILTIFDHEIPITDFSGILGIISLIISGVILKKFVSNIISRLM